MAGNAEVGWAGLPDDLIQKVVDNYLSTEDLDYYVFFRRLCGGWRRATAEPHFMPNNWIILDHSLSLDDLVGDAAVKLMNVRTGRIVEKKIHKLIRRCFSSAYILSFVDLVFVNELPLFFSLIKSPTPFSMKVLPCRQFGGTYRARPESAALQDSAVQPLDGCHEAPQGADTGGTVVRGGCVDVPVLEGVRIRLPQS